MSNKKRRDWSEWNEHITGMHRLDKRFDQPHLSSRISPDHTSTSTALNRRDLLDEEETEKLNLRVWVLVFLCALVARKCYFEFTKYNKLKSPQTISRDR